MKSLARALDIVASITMIAAALILIWMHARETGTERMGSQPALDISSTHVELDVRDQEPPVSPGQVVIIEFADFQCPYSRRYVKEVFGAVKKGLIDTGRARYAVFNFPLENLHPQSFAASAAARCAIPSKHFWEMRTLLFEHQNALEPAALRTYARLLGIDHDAFEKCLQDPTTVEGIRADIAQGQRAGVAATPSFIVGQAQPSGRVLALRMISGVVPFATLDSAVEDVSHQVDSRWVSWLLRPIFRH
jgi:protein-disulfide isomerase